MDNLEENKDKIYQTFQSLEASELKENLQKEPEVIDFSDETFLKFWDSFNNNIKKKEEQEYLAKPAFSNLLNKKKKNRV